MAFVNCTCSPSTGGDHAHTCPFYQPVKIIPAGVTIPIGPVPAPAVPTGWCCPGCGTYNSPTVLKCPCKPATEGDAQRKILFG